MSMKRKGRSWTYHGENGQSTWPSENPDAGGKSQSPININSRDTIYHGSLADNGLEMSYSISRDTNLANIGQTVVLNPHCKSSVTGGPLIRGHIFELSDIVFHWGADDHRGSEHTVNDKALPMELHMTHWNSSLYRNANDAMGKPNGLTVIAIFIQIGREHSGLKTISDSLEDILYKGREISLTNSFNPNCLLPDPMLRDYWTYQGSLTAPPCSEHVTWIIFRYPLTVSHSQIEEFRRLRSHGKGEGYSKTEDGALVDNYRLTQPLNGRAVFASFQ